MDLQRGQFSVKMYAKMKELGPIGGVHLACPLDLPMLFPKSGGQGPWAHLATALVSSKLYVSFATTTKLYFPS